MIDIKKLKNEVSKAVVDENYKNAKEKLLSKERELTSAKKVVRNIKRDIEDLYLEIAG